MTIAEARDLGAAIGCDFFLTGGAETLRRSSSARPVYYEAYAAIFLVSARTGRLLSWRRPSVHSSTPAAAAQPLRSELAQPAISQWLAQKVIETLQAEQNERVRAVETDVPVIEEAPDPDAQSAKEVQTPRPYRRLRPAYPETAANAEAEATIDALADIDERGEVGQVQIVRWGGFGLDEATAATIHQLHFYPAKRNGQPVPMRVLLRYNFRKPPPDAKK
jgi:outer membrane biosynthesis protein TonB